MKLHKNNMALSFAETRNMSDFIESEAEESEEEFEEKDLKPKKAQRFMEDDGKILSVFNLVIIYQNEFR